MGAKRTSLIHALMSANDPKRTCRTGSKSFRQGSMRWLHWEIDGFAGNKRLAALFIAFIIIPTMTVTIAPLTPPPTS